MFPKLSLKVALLAVAVSGGSLALFAPTGAFASPSFESHAMPPSLRLALYEALAQRGATPAINEDGCTHFAKPGALSLF